MDTIPQYKIDNAYLKLPEATQSSYERILILILSDEVVSVKVEGSIFPATTRKYKRILFEKQRFSDGTYKYIYKK